MMLDGILDEFPIPFGCFTMVYIAIFTIVTLMVLTIVNIRKKRNNPLVPDMDQPTTIMLSNEGRSWKLNLALAAVIILLSTGFYMIVIDIIF